MRSPNPTGRQGPANPRHAGRSTDEDALLETIRQVLAEACGDQPEGELWIGDDAAVVTGPDGRLVLATDATVEGVHVDLSIMGWHDMGWKAITAAVSDLGAMGARPRSALLTICSPTGADLEALVTGVAAASARWRCPVVGGDLSNAEQVVVSVSVTGDLPRGANPVGRAGAMPGDRLFVTGPLGASAAGLRLLRAARSDAEVDPYHPHRGERWSHADGLLVDAHRHPIARLAEGMAAGALGASAMLDISDGLSVDVGRLAAASGVGIDLDDVPVAEGATLSEALGGGEDYELVIAASDAGRLVSAFEAQGLRAPLSIGTCTADPGRLRFRGERLERTGWVHEFAGDAPDEPSRTTDRGAE